MATALTRRTGRERTSMANTNKHGVGTTGPEPLLPVVCYLVNTRLYIRDTKTLAVRKRNEKNLKTAGMWSERVTEEHKTEERR